MTLPVHLVDDLAQYAAGARVTVEGDEAHHAVAVRRLTVGEQVMLCDGRGRRGTGTIVETGKRRLVVHLDELLDEDRPTPRFTVVQALPKGDRGELAVEVLTEIGVDTVVPWAASRSVAVWRGPRAEKSHAKWVATAREAGKQARRSWFPEVTPLESTDQICARIAASDLAVVLHEDAVDPLPEEIGADVLVVVGPEGGISPAEVAAFTAAGARTVRLGSEVLRTSTAGVAAVSAMLALTSRWGR